MRTLKTTFITKDKILPFHWGEISCWTFQYASFGAAETGWEGIEETAHRAMERLMGGNYSDYYGFYNGGGGAFTTSLSNYDKRVILNRLNGSFLMSYRIGGMPSGPFYAFNGGGFDPNDRGGGGGSKSGWSPLYKSTLLGYVRTTRCSDCSEGQLQNNTGRYYERLFEEYIDANYAFDNFRVSPAPGKFQGEYDYTVPDYVGVRYSTNGRRVEAKVHSYYELESFFELKATKRNIGLGSFDGQIKTQIQTAKRAGVGELIFITTYGVNLTKPLHNYATQQGIQLTHYWKQYRMVNGQMQTNYIRTK